MKSTTTAMRKYFRSELHLKPLKIKICEFKNIKLTLWDLNDTDNGYAYRVDVNKDGDYTYSEHFILKLSAKIHYYRLKIKYKMTNVDLLADEL